MDTMEEQSLVAQAMSHSERKAIPAMLSKTKKSIRIKS
jgi:hypothetical protein